FFRTAAAILLRPLPAPGQEQTSIGANGKYMVLKRLLPLFEQYSNAETAEAVRAQMQALATGVPDDLRQRDDDAVREGIRPPEKSEDREKSLLDRIDHAKTSDERDGLYFQLARLYVDKPDLRAREFVDKVEDPELRKQLRAFVDGSLLIRMLDK